MPRLRSPQEPSNVLFAGFLATLMPVPWVLAGNGLLLVLLGATVLLRRNPEGVTGL